MSALRQRAHFKASIGLGLLLMLGGGWANAHGGMMGGGMMGGGMMGGYASAPSDQSDGNDSGARLFQRTCSQCHALPSPSAHTAKQWPAVVDRMRAHIRQYGGRDLSDQQAQAIDDYLKKHTGD